MSEKEICDIIKQYDIIKSSFAFTVKEDKSWKYHMTLSTRDLNNFTRLRKVLLEQDNLRRFSLIPSSLL